MSYLYRTILCATAPTQTLPHSTPSHQPFSRHTRRQNEPDTSGICSRDQPKIPQKLAEEKNRENTNETDISRYNGASHHAAIQQKQGYERSTEKILMVAPRPGLDKKKSPSPSVYRKLDEPPKFAVVPFNNRNTKEIRKMDYRTQDATKLGNTGTPTMLPHAERRREMERHEPI
jgi:hypothetical protein